MIIILMIRIDENDPEHHDDYKFHSGVQERKILMWQPIPGCDALKI